jgi:hypothetical protein
MEEFDPIGYAKLVLWVSSLKPRAVGVEDVHAFPGQGVVSMFSQGFGLGLWHQALACVDITPVKIRPQVWRKTYWPSGSLSKEERKKASILKVKELFGLEVKKDGEAEALLIAEHLRRLHRDASRQSAGTSQGTSR